MYRIKITYLFHKNDEYDKKEVVLIFFIFLQ